MEAEQQLRRMQREVVRALAAVLRDAPSMFDRMLEGTSYEERCLAVDAFRAYPTQVLLILDDGSSVMVGKEVNHEDDRSVRNLWLPPF